MSKLVTVFRYLYGSGPLHLLTMVAGFALLAYVVITAGPSTLWKPDGEWWQSIALWFGAAIIFHDLVLFPLYALTDRLLGPRSRTQGKRLLPARNYVRLPALGSGLLLLLFLPDITHGGAGYYLDGTGMTQAPFLGRWLIITAVMFGLSACLYAIRFAVTSRRGRGQAKY